MLETISKSLTQNLPILISLSFGFTAPCQAGNVKLGFHNADGRLAVDNPVRYFGESTGIKAEGLKANEEYAIEVRSNIFGSAYESRINFKSNENGEIDTSLMAPSSGSYSGVDADGPFWSLTRSNGTTSLPSFHFEISIKEEGVVLKSAILRQGTTKPSVKSVPLAGTGLVGQLFIPEKASTHPAPAVITFSGSEGGSFTGITYAAALANEGFVTLGLGYFGGPGLPASLKEIPLEYFEKAIKFLQSRPEVNKNQIAVMGPSRGGELSLLLGSTFPQIKAVVAQVPSPYRWGANVDEATSSAAWVYKNQAFPYLEVAGDLTPIQLPDGRTAYSNRKSFENGLKAATPAQRESAMSQIENIQGPVLFLGGEDDHLWPSCDLSKIAMARLKEKKHPYSDEIYCYPKAGHGVTLFPGVFPSTDIATEHPQMHIILFSGGTPEANGRGQRELWNKTIQFLTKTFGRR